MQRRVPRTHLTSRTHKHPSHPSTEEGCVLIEVERLDPQGAQGGRGALQAHRHSSFEAEEPIVH